MKTKEILREIAALMDLKDSTSAKLCLFAKIAELMAHLDAKPEIPEDVLSVLPQEYRGTAIQAFCLLLLQSMK